MSEVVAPSLCTPLAGVQRFLDRCPEPTRFLDARGRSNPPKICCPEENLHFSKMFHFVRKIVRLPKFLTTFFYHIFFYKTALLDVPRLDARGRRTIPTPSARRCTGLDDERGIQRVEGESWTSW